MTELAAAWGRLASDVRACKGIDNLIAAKSNSISMEALKERTQTVISELHEAYLEHLANKPIEDLSDERLRSFTRYTDGMPLKDYENALDLVPELVNLVSLADALPLDGSTLPFDLKKIAVRCRGAVYFAPRRFTAVQLAFDEPRSRVLLFHTGRVVGTGCDSATAAKLAVARALKTIAMEASVHVAVRRFAVINQASAKPCTVVPEAPESTAHTQQPLLVGAIALGAKLDCDAFADTHSSTAHYDPKSFVGLAWRPVSECICSEIYSTGKANLPGSRRERQLLRAFARMAPELLRHSEKPELSERFSERLRRAHKPEGHTRQAPRATARAAEGSADGAGASGTSLGETMQSLWDDDTCDNDAGQKGKSTRKRSIHDMFYFDGTCEDHEESAFGEFFDGF